MRLRLAILWGVGWLYLLTAWEAYARQPASEVPTDSVVVRSVSVEGNLRTRTPIILREMTLTEGRSLLKAGLDELLEADRRKISNTNLFVTTAVRTLETSSPDSLDIRVEV